MAAYFNEAYLKANRERIEELRARVRASELRAAAALKAARKRVLAGAPAPEDKDNG